VERNCNIDSKGKLFRLIIGLLSVSGGIVLVSLFNYDVLISYTALTIGLMSIMGGLFAIWEAREGWCVVRAIGIKTPF
jgi:hypothetical protein|tara:strand:- start:1206 stop:1439 length:234 start_codon:yes stop_codon:yes gene_type:complete